MSEQELVLPSPRLLGISHHHHHCQEHRHTILLFYVCGQEAPLSLSCHVMPFCEWTMARGSIVTSRRHIGRIPLFFLFFFFFFFFSCVLFLFFLLFTGRGGASSLAAGLFLAMEDSIGIFSAPCGYVFSLLLMLLSIIAVRTPRVL